ncbi:hypothetical protein DL89DRAFT_269197 [Linderina pennispora]|uniref:NAD(P)-binding protein n=1 Tax=Linderina pennispora TaxID=61395 RepID=A0A1Y1W492_9FUNG|nr:uncharacterized protein DL89DRAFT_269197 [Linderina pennispora]ORX68056.1 hypothetical protein DL89DRAFT_269197 [Linderina pennispora]
MADNRLVAVVTGANKGIGKATVRLLLLQTERPMVIYLTARNVERGQAAFDDIKREQSRIQAAFRKRAALPPARCLRPRQHTHVYRLPVINTRRPERRHPDQQRRRSRARPQRQGRVARLQHGDRPQDCPHELLYCCQHHIATCCHICALAAASSSWSRPLAHLGIFSGELPKVLVSDELNLNGLHIIENGFISSVGKGTYAEYGFPPMPFAVAKAGLIAYSRMLARIFAPDPRNLFFAAVCPGYCQTDMTGPYAPLQPSQGAETPAYLATADTKRIQRHNGCLWKNKKQIKW